MRKRLKRVGSLTDHEVGIIRNLLERGSYKNQEILGMINMVRRQEGHEEINGGRISEVKTNYSRYDGIGPTSDNDANTFIEKAENPVAYTGDSSNPLDSKYLESLFPVDEGEKGRLAITETDLIECKETFGGHYMVSNCLRAIAAFANNKGGYIAFGIKDSTWEITGIDGTKFTKYDRKKFSQKILSVFNAAIEFETVTLNIGEKSIGVMYFAPAKIKPVIAIKNDRDNIQAGCIYYRYQAENRLIGSTELQQIIEDRIRDLSETILAKHLSTILNNGIENSAVLNIDTGLVDGKAGSFLINEDLLPKISFIKEGEFQEKSGAPTLKLVGEIKQTQSAIKTQKEELIKLYPFSWTELEESVNEKVPGAKRHIINHIIREHKLKSDKKYSAYNFRYKRQFDEYEATGVIPKGITSIYNQAAVDFVAEKTAELIISRSH